MFYRVPLKERKKIIQPGFVRFSLHSEEGIDLMKGKIKR